MNTSIRLLISLLLALCTVHALKPFNSPGNVIISDSYNYRVIEVSPDDGQIVWSFSPPNDETGYCLTSKMYPYSAFRLPAPSTYTIIAADAYSCGKWVYIVDQDANIVWRWGGWTDDSMLEEVLKEPTFAIMTESNTILITDAAQVMIFEVDLEGNIVQSYSNPGGSKANFIIPTATMPVAGTDHWLVTDAGANRVVEMKPDGTIVKSWTKGLSQPTFAMYTTNGDLLVSDQFNNRVLLEPKSGADGAATWSLSPVPIDEDTGIEDPRNFDNPTAALLLKNGSLLVTDHSHNRVVIVSDPTKGADYGWYYGMGDSDHRANTLDNPTWAHVVNDYTGLPLPKQPIKLGSGDNTASSSSGASQTSSGSESGHGGETGEDHRSSTGSHSGGGSDTGSDTGSVTGGNTASTTGASSVSHPAVSSTVITPSPSSTAPPAVGGLDQSSGPLATPVTQSSSTASTNTVRSSSSTGIGVILGGSPTGSNGAGATVASLLVTLMSIALAWITAQRI